MLYYCEIGMNMSERKSKAGSSHLIDFYCCLNESLLLENHFLLIFLSCLFDCCLFNQSQLLLLLKNVLNCSQLIYHDVLISAVQQNGLVIQICALLFMFVSIMFYHRILNIVPVLYSRILLFIHCIYNSLHLLIPDC